MNTLKKFINRNPILTTILIIFFELFLLHFNFGFPTNNLLIKVFKEIILATLTLSFIYLITGKEELIFSTKGINFAFKECLWMLFVALTTGIVFTVLLIYGNHPLNKNFFFIIIEMLFYTLFLALFEESLIRGLFMNALLVRYGGTITGIIKTVTYSSIVFGFIHIVPDFIDSLSISGFLNLTVIEQMLGKVIQMATFGFILAAVYLKNHNLWSVSILHMINDFLMDLPAHLFTNLGNLGSYVRSSGNQNIIIYIIMSVLSLPGIFVGYKICKSIKLPQPGFFRICWFPLNVKNIKKN